MRLVADNQRKIWWCHSPTIPAHMIGELFNQPRKFLPERLATTQEIVQAEKEFAAKQT